MPRKAPKGIRKLPRYEHGISAVLIAAKEAIIRPMRPKLRDFEITEPQWRVMRVLNDREKTDATSLAQEGVLQVSSVARILKELEARQLVEREPDASDRRRSVVRLTPAGYAIVDGLSNEVLRIMEAYSGRYGHERLQWLQDELNALSEAIEGVR